MGNRYGGSRDNSRKDNTFHKKDKERQAPFVLQR